MSRHTFWIRRGLEVPQETSKQITKAKCEDCTWSYKSCNKDGGAVTKARAKAHAWEFGHMLVLSQDILDIYIERIGPPSELGRN